MTDNDKSEQSVIEGRQAMSSAIATLTAESRNQLYVLANDLDPLIYSNDAFAEQLSALARRSRRPDIRILLHQPSRLLSYQHRALPLMQRLSSLIDVRQLHEQYRNLWQSYLINDQPMMLYQATYERYDATLSSDTKAINEERKQFEKMWQYSNTATQLRRQFI
ncbi:MAG: hypothetical protein COB61_009590 [Thiotrichales bacterium]|nr:hypothetical protein [Thiotrichales bacterium]